jgi:hypothetical protein
LDPTRKNNCSTETKKLTNSNLPWEEIIEFEQLLLKIEIEKRVP